MGVLLLVRQSPPALCSLRYTIATIREYLGWVWAAQHLEPGQVWKEAAIRGHWRALMTPRDIFISAGTFVWYGCLSTCFKNAFERVLCRFGNSGIFHKLAQRPSWGNCRMDCCAWAHLGLYPFVSDCLHWNRLGVFSVFTGRFVAVCCRRILGTRWGLKSYSNIVGVLLRCHSR